MADYGLKVAKSGVDLRTSTAITDLSLSMQFPLVKVDQTSAKSFQSIMLTFLSNPPLSTRTQLYSFAHEYDYLPQAWGLWNVTTMPSFASYDQAYGTYVASSGVGLNLVLDYTIDETNVTLYGTFTDSGGGNTVIGTVAVLTLYIFADDLQTQDYT